MGPRGGIWLEEQNHKTKPNSPREEWALNNPRKSAQANSHTQNKVCRISQTMATKIFDGAKENAGNGNFGILASEFRLDALGKKVKINLCEFSRRYSARENPMDDE